jgi:ABC-type bacteriocin/lantibiotic exporter with double-glycine peptidase domain
MKESKFKYRVANWLHEMARNNDSFKNEINYDFALQKNNLLVNDYLNYREQHFNIIKRQFSQLIVFKVIITSGLLLIGGFLVLSQEMNIGQFVASEIIILLVINSAEKIILGLETFYDVLTSIEKIGEITDLELEEEINNENGVGYTSINLEAENIGFKFPDSNKIIINDISIKIKQGEKIILNGENGSGKSTLIKILCGALKPKTGSLFINDDTFKKLNTNQFRLQIACVLHGESTFEGTLKENITFNDPSISYEDVKWAIESVQLTSFIKSLPKGLETPIFPESNQLSSSNAQKILLARSIIRKPKMLFYEDPTSTMDETEANKIIDFLTSNENKWSIIVSSKNPYWKTKCNRKITMQKGNIQLDLNTESPC